MGKFFRATSLMRASWEVLKQDKELLLFPLLSGACCVLLRLIEQRSNLVGKIVGALLGMAWSLTSFLVIPILVIDNESPVGAL